MFACSYLAGRWRAKLVIDLFAQHQQYSVSRAYFIVFDKFKNLKAFKLWENFKEDLQRLGLTKGLS